MKNRERDSNTCESKTTRAFYRTNGVTDCRRHEVEEEKAGLGQSREDESGKVCENRGIVADRRFDIDTIFNRLSRSSTIYCAWPVGTTNFKPPPPRTTNIYSNDESGSSSSKSDFDDEKAQCVRRLDGELVETGLHCIGLQTVG